MKKSYEYKFLFIKALDNDKINNIHKLIAHLVDTCAFDSNDFFSTNSAAVDNFTSLENLCLEINEQNNQGNVVINEEALLSYYERKSIFALSEEVLQEKRTIQQHYVNK